MSHGLLAVGGLVLLARLAGTGEPESRPSIPDVEHLWQLYAEAVAKAKRSEPAAISRDLTPIVRFSEELQWTKQGNAVLMATWTKRSYYEGTAGEPYDLPVSVWLTAVPQFQRACRPLRMSPEGRALRMRQLLGLPPDADYDTVVEMWVDPTTLFRPCPDPEVTDRECQLTLSGSAADPEAPCPWQASIAPQVSRNWVTVSPDHVEWMCSNWQSAYPRNEPRKSYPWTALGYTYDWGNPADPRGLSEFVAPAGTRVVIRSVTSTEDYCSAPEN